MSMARRCADYLLVTLQVPCACRSPLVTIAAIRGACPAAGCNIALCCDHRIMTEQGYIGLNEVAIGISVPEKWCDLMGRTIGQGPASQLLQFARVSSHTGLHGAHCLKACADHACPVGEAQGCCCAAGDPGCMLPWDQQYHYLLQAAADSSRAQNAAHCD